MSDQPSSNDIVADLRARYKCTVGYTRDIYAAAHFIAEHRDLDVRAADEIERLRRDLAHWKDCHSVTADALAAARAGHELLPAPTVWRRLLDSPYTLHPQWHYTNQRPTIAPEKWEPLYSRASQHPGLGQLKKSGGGDD